MHTRARPRWQIIRRDTVAPVNQTQKRGIAYFQGAQSLDVLSQYDVPVLKNTSYPERTFEVNFQVHRAHYSPALHLRRHARAVPSGTNLGTVGAQLIYLLDGDTAAFDKDLDSFLSQWIWYSNAERSRMKEILLKLKNLYREKEAKHFWITVGMEHGAVKDQEASFGVVDAELEFDAWAYAMAKRHEDLHSQQIVTEEMKVEVEVAKENIVFLKSASPLRYLPFLTKFATGGPILAQSSAHSSMVPASPQTPSTTSTHAVCLRPTSLIPAAKRPPTPSRPPSAPS